MSRPAKALLVIELVVCFGPAALQWLLGMIIIPLTLIYGPKYELGTLLALASVVAGTLGLYALLTVTTMIFSGKPSKHSPRVLLTFALIGLVPLLPLALGTTDSPWWRLVGLLPFVGAAHLIYLAREQLFMSSSAPG